MTQHEETDAAPGRAKGVRRWSLALAVLLLLLALGGYGIVWHWQSTSAALLGSARLQFVHADGTPVAGAAARVYWTTLRDLGPFYAAAALGPAAADGTVDLTPLAGEWAVGAGFDVEVDLPGFDQDRVTLAPRTVVTLPPVGRVLLRLVDGKGEPYARPLPRQGATLVCENGARSHRRRVVYGADGSADFGIVACGCKLRVLAEVQGLWAYPRGLVARNERQAATVSELMDHEILGPDAPNSLREIVCVVPDDAPRLRAVVLDADGAPVRRDFGLALHYDGSTFGAFTVSTDAKGQFEFLFGSAAKHDGELQLWTGGEAPITVRAAVSGDGDLDAGIVRLP